MLALKVPLVLLASSTSVTPAPPRVGLLLTEVLAYRTPRLVRAAPPSLVTVPPSVAEVAVIAVTVGLVTLGAVVPAAWFTVIDWPSTVRWPVRAAPALVVNVKWITPAEMVPTVSQLWSLLGTKGPDSGSV